MKKIIIVIAIAAMSLPVISQDTILDYYVTIGIENNLALKQKHANYNKSIYALKEAKGMFYPNLSLQARYSVADGGRTIDLPIGDLMNPIYNSLNGITSAMYMNGLIADPANIFPDTSISNQEIAFMRPQEHETKLELVQPILNSQINYNYKIKKQLTEIESYSVDAYQRTLIAEIKSAYFNCLKTNRLLEVLDESEKLVQENIRLNQKLYDNDKVTIDAVYRSQTELSKLHQQLANAKKLNKTAKAYFNFLLNRNLEEYVADATILDISSMLIDVNTAKANTENREEMYQLKSYEGVMETAVKLNNSNKLPTLTAVVDYGFQGEDYRFGADDDFVIASLVLRWDLFKGFQNKNKIAQAKVDLASISYKREEVKNQLKLEAISAYYDVEASAEAIIAAKDELKTSQKNYDIVEKKYEQGQSNLLELIDARTSLSNAKQNLIINEYDYYSKCAELERVTASVSIDNYSKKQN